MDLIILDSGISDCIGDLASLDSCDRLGHLFGVFLERFLRNVADESSNSLWNRLGRNNDDLLVLSKISCLVCREDDVLIIRKDVDRLGIDFVDRVQHILSTWIHGLTALDQIVYTKFFEYVCESVTCGHCDEANFLCRFLFLLFFCLLFGKFLCVFDKFFLMFFAHIVDLHTGKGSISQCTLDRLSRMIGVHMDFDDLIVCNENDGITDGSQEFLEFVFFFDRKRFVQKDDEFCTVTEFDIRLCLWRDLGHCRSRSLLKVGIIYFFAEEAVNGTS